jgi:preprotein translocase subunit YajC
VFGASDTLVQLVPIVAMIGIVYFVLWRPQQRRAKEQRELVQAARRGDVVVTTGGLIGKVTKSVDDNEVEFEIAPNVRVRLARSGISEVRAKGEPVKDPTPPAKSPAAKKDAPNP